MSPGSPDMMSDVAAKDCIRTVGRLTVMLIWSPVNHAFPHQQPCGLSQSAFTEPQGCLYAQRALLPLLHAEQVKGGALQGWVLRACAVPCSAPVPYRR